MEKLMHFFRDEDGVVNIEYGLIAGIIALAVVAILWTMSGSLQTVYTAVDTNLADAAAGAPTP